MKINICTVKKNRGECIEFSFSMPVHDVLPSDLAQDFWGEIKVDGTVTNVGTGLLVKAFLHAKVKDFCARCLEELSKDIDVEFSEEYFLPGDGGEEEFLKCEGDFLDIKELVAEIVLAEKPVKSLCRDDCQGLCPVCGQNLNEKLCSCDRQSIDPRLEKLKNYIN